MEECVEFYPCGVLADRTCFSVHPTTESEVAQESNLSETRPKRQPRHVRSRDTPSQSHL
jgi:hypothetical protein